MNDLNARVAIGIILFLALSVSVFYRRRAGAADPSARRGDEPTNLKLLRLSVALPGVVVIAASLLAPDALPWAVLDLPPSVRSLGVGVAAVGLALVCWLFPHLGNNVTATALVKEQHRLVTTGPYRWIRHPLYVSGLLLLAGLGLGAASWPVLALAGAVLCLWVGVVIPREEQALASRFGEEYELYRRATGALVPRLWQTS